MSESHFNYGSGLGSTGQYLISGHPFVTGGSVPGGSALNGEVRINFPRVSKSFTIINSGTKPICVYYDTRANANVFNNNHYVMLSSSYDSFGFDIRTDHIYVCAYNSADTGSFQLHAELTGIDAREMYVLSGSGIND